ncbi:MAG TPA: beta-L-arabinofuranosidase domain-containing protein [Opitutales bacterium]|nr:beta-L-arabinofuranosidase domain-containing protein [Opitutales bacterium]
MKNPRSASLGTCACCGRRQFLATSFSATAALLLTRALGHAADALPALGPAAAAPGVLHPIANVVPFEATPLPLSAVRLTGGPLKRAQDLGRQNLLRLDMDKLMYRFRERAGLPAKTDDGYPGWEGPGRQLTGAMAGHYLSGVSYMYAATGDAEFKRRADYLVGEYQAVQDAYGDGYLGALMGSLPRGAMPENGQVEINGKLVSVYIPDGWQPGRRNGPQPAVDGKALFEEIKAGVINSGAFDLNGMWSPWYVQHKLLAGLRDAYRQTGNRAALDVAVKFAAWTEGVVGGLSDAQMQRMLGTEFGGINESFADLYADTGDDRWLKLSQKFHHDAIVNPLADHRDILAGKHGNTNVPKLLGELVRQIYGGNAPDGEAAKFFWEAVVNHHTFATGGHGYDEAFGPPDRLSDEVDGTGQRSADLRTCESCNVYNMVKLTRLLFALQPDNKFAEFHERALFNHVLGSINFNDGQLCYMVPVSPGETHEYQGLYGMTCCCGTGLENHALHGFGVYYTSAGKSLDKLWVNFYTPSTAAWAGQGVNLETTVAPGDTAVATLKITANSAKELTLALRRPFWAGEGFALKVNGEPVKDLPPAGTYAELKRTWKTGDTVEVSLPKALYPEPLADNPNRVALKWGPYVLGADYSQPNAQTVAQAAEAAATAANSAGGGAVGQVQGGGRGRRGGGGRQAKYPVFLAKAGEPVSNWLKRVMPTEMPKPDATTDLPVVFHATGVGGDNNEVTFKPFYQLSGRRYGIYQDIYTAEEWQQRNAPASAPPAASTPA